MVLLDAPLFVFVPVKANDLDTRVVFLKLLVLFGCCRKSVMRVTDRGSAPALHIAVLEPIIKGLNVKVVEFFFFAHDF